MKLVFGVMDVAYTHATGDDVAASAKTTGDVAEILESKYHVMETFFALRKDRIAKILEQSVADNIQAVINGQRPTDHSALTFEGEQKIEAEFRAFLTADEMSTLVGALSPIPEVGVVGGFTGAAGRGVSHRKLHPYAQKNKARPAFVDTGLYRASFRAWISRNG